MRMLVHMMQYVSCTMYQSMYILYTRFVIFFLKMTLALVDKNGSNWTTALFEMICFYTLHELSIFVSVWFQYCLFAHYFSRSTMYIVQRTNHLHILLVYLPLNSKAQSRERTYKFENSFGFISSQVCAAVQCSHHEIWHHFFACLSCCSRLFLSCSS